MHVLAAVEQEDRDGRDICARMRFVPGHDEKANRPERYPKQEATMGIFDWLSGTKRPKAGVAPQSAAAVRTGLLAVNRPTAPFVVRDGRAENVDLVAEWRIVDASWFDIFGKAGLTKVFKILMRLDPDRQEVRAVDQEWSVEWRAGIPRLTLSAEAFRGQKSEISFGTEYALIETTGAGQVYRYRFSTGELKPPLQEAVTNAGWTWRGVSFGKL
jgi:hypothetical protein